LVKDQNVFANSLGLGLNSLTTGAVPILRGSI